MKDIHELESLLLSLKKDGVPADTFRTNARIRILNTVTNPHPFRASWYQRPRVIGYTFGSAIATVVLSVGTVFAAQTSLPTHTLYPVKVLSERVALTLSPTESLKTTIASSIISRRITEIETVQKQGNKKDIEESIANFDEDVEVIQKRKGISHSEIDSEIEEHKEFIDSLRKNHKKNDEDDTDDASQETVTQTPQRESDSKLPSIEGASTNRRDD